MQDTLEEWSFAPIVGKLVGATVVLVVIYVPARALRRLVASQVKDSDRRYRLRNAISGWK